VVDFVAETVTEAALPAAEVPGFAALGVMPEIVAALDGVGITAPFPIQALTLPIALSGADLIGQARTGTGKTLAFGIPLLQRISLPGGGKPQALVVVPTRELCVQVTKDIATAGSSQAVRTLSIYGGRSYEPQVEALRKGIDVVVGTPGRLLDLAKQGHLDLSEVRALVLDEADEMLDLGFLPDVERILALVNGDRQTMLFSATMPGPIVTLARRFMSRPTHITAEQPDENRTVPTTAQHIFRAHSMDKGEMLARILQADGRGLTMVFCRTKRTCDKVALDMIDRGFAAAAVHGDLGQGQREQALRAFRAGKIDVLVATDVAARGIDVSGVTHVVNYQCPEDEKTYLHRIGRTGRAGETGIAVTFVDWDDLPRWSLINTALELPFPDPPETYSNSASLYEAIDIPRAATGRLPRAQRTRLGLAAEAVEDLGETGRARRPRPGAGPAAGGRSGAAGTTRDREQRHVRAGTDSTGTDSSGTDSTESAADAAPRRSRNRRRTRGAGAAAAAGPTAGPSTGGSAAAAVPSAVGPARRRRRRGGRGRGGTGGGGGGGGGDGTFAEGDSSAGSPAREQQADSA